MREASLGKNSSNFVKGGSPERKFVKTDAADWSELSVGG